MLSVFSATFNIRSSSTNQSYFFVNGTIGNIGIKTINATEGLTLNATNFLQTSGNPKHMSNLSDGVGGAVLAGASSVFVSGKYAFVTSSSDDALEIVDISNPLNSVHVGNLSNGVQGAKLDEAYDVKVSGKYAYVVSSTSHSFEIIDISNPSMPMRVGNISNGVGGVILNTPRQVYISNGFAYIVNYNGNSLEIIDVSDPFNPKHAYNLADGAGGAQLAGCYGVYVLGKYAYVASRSDSALDIIDVSNPYSPFHVGSYSSLLNPIRVYVSGKYAYVVLFSASGHGLSIVDVSNPASPSLVSTLSGGFGQLLDSPRDVVISGKYAYLLSTGAHSLVLLDVSNPLSISIKGNISNSVGGAQLNSPFGIFVSGKYAYVASITGGTLEIIDISGIDSPAANIGTISTSLLSVTENAEVKNDLSIGSGLTVGGNVFINSKFSVSNDTYFRGKIGIGTTMPNQILQVIGNVNVSGVLYSSNVSSNSPLQLQTSGFTRIFINDTTGNVGINTTKPTQKLFVEGNMTVNGTLIVDKNNFNQNLGNIKHVANFTTGTSGALFDDPMGIAIQGNYLFMTSQSTYHSVLAFDISNPTNPVFIGNLSNGVQGAVLMTPRGIHVQGKYAYVGSFNNGALEIIDISNPYNMTHVSSLSGMGSPQHVYVSGNRVYVSCEGSGFYIIDISNPFNPILVKFLSAGEGMYTYVFGKYAYFVERGGNTLRTFDIYNSSPYQVGSVTTGSGPVSVYVSGKYAFVTTYFANRFEVYNVSNPANITLISNSYATNINGPRWFTVVGDYAYIASQTADKIEVVDISDPLNLRHVTNLSNGVDGARLDNPYAVAISGKYLYVSSEGTSDSLEVIEIHGIDSPSANIGSVQTDQLRVGNNVIVSNDLYVGSGFSVGGNAKFDNDITIGNILRLVNRTTAPSYAVEGAVYYDSTTHEPCVYNSTAWKGFVTGGACT
jgi:hypothetical protein